MKPEWSCLKDATILDVSQLLPGPHTATLLEQLGADVIKIENPETGDTSRLLGPSVFAQFNRGKRSVALDLKSPEGKAAFLSLVQRADAVIEGFRPGVMQRLGLDYDALAAVNPAIVMCSISGFGQDGPYAKEAGHDLNYLALSGYWAVPVQVHDKVSRPRARISDFAASAYASLAMSVAIMSARQSGRGQHLDVSILDAITAWTAHGAWGARGLSQDELINAPTVMPENDLFATRDGRHLAMGILENKFWVNLCEVLGDEYPALRDPRMATRPQRLKIKAEVNALLVEVFASKTLDEWSARFAGADLPFSPVLHADEFFDDAQLNARQMIQHHPVEGQISVRFPVKFSAGLPDMPSKVPSLGEHTEEILGESGSTT
ncbi:MAG TPA: CoA transferase [Variovorax sp.]